MSENKRMVSAGMGAAYELVNLIERHREKNRQFNHKSYIEVGKQENGF